MSARRRLLVVAVAAFATVVVLAAVVVAVGDGAGRPERAAQERPGPVLLVPGYGGGRESLLVLAARIRAAGRAAQVLTLPGDGTGDLVAQARVLSEAAAGAVSAGAPSVDVVGYSAGGVVARVAVADAATARRVRRVVTLGAPLQGARIAAAGGVLAPGACPVACQQLTPGSALLRELAGRPLPGQLPWLSIWTEDDRTVMPPDSARLAGAVNVSLQELCAGTRVQHGELPTDPLAVGLVLRALGTDPPRAPDPAECAAIRAEGFSS